MVEKFGATDSKESAQKVKDNQRQTRQ